MRDGDMPGRGFFWFINAPDDLVTGRVWATATRNFAGSAGDAK